MRLITSKPSDNGNSCQLLHGAISFRMFIENSGSPLTRIVNRIVACTIMLLVSCSMLSAQFAGTWATKTPMPTARNQYSASEVNGVIYVVGGCTGNGSCTMVAAVDVYDPASDTWTSKASIPTVRAGLSTSAVNGVIYAIGGSNVYGNGYVGTVEAYDPANDTWTTKTSMPTPRTGLSTSVVNGIIYAIGGGDSAILSTVEAYDPASNTWTTKASMPTGFIYGSTSVVNGIIYAVGGIPNQAGVEAYSPASDTWTTKASIPTARTSLSTSAVNDVIYAVGGAAGGSSIALGTVEAYDPASDTWTTKASMPTPRYNFSAGVVNGVVYSMGGVANYITLATNEAFTPTPPYAAQIQQPIDPNGSSVFTAKRGVVPVKFTLTLGGNTTCQLPPATISLTRTAGTVLGSIDQSQYLLASDSGSTFRIDTSSCQYVYNLGTGSLGTGTYTVNISIGGSVVGSSTFGLQ